MSKGQLYTVQQDSVLGGALGPQFHASSRTGESCSQEKDLGVFADSQLAMNQQCAKKADSIWLVSETAWPAGLGKPLSPYPCHCWGCTLNTVFGFGFLTKRKTLRCPEKGNKADKGSREQVF